MRLRLVEVLIDLGEHLLVFGGDLLEFDEILDDRPEPPPAVLEGLGPLPIDILNQLEYFLAKLKYIMKVKNYLFLFMISLAILNQLCK